jgi:DNA-binding NarL/FixJ family response regulator
MTRVRIKASSRLVEAGLRALFRAFPALSLVEAEATDGGLEMGPPAPVLLAEADSLGDASVREAVEWAEGGGATVLLLRSPAVDSLTAALRSGVRAILPASAEGTEIAAAVEAAAAGLVVLDARTVESLLPLLPVGSAAQPVTLAEDLTPREIEVLKLVAAGLANKEIAHRLEISDHTVKFHVASVMGKLGASSRTEAVTLGIRLGLIMI